jgi:photosystem II stability/assembly factor-like uncharacterized protein
MKLINTKILALLVILNCGLFSQWYAQPSGTIYALKSVHFINETTGFICTYNSVLKTTNAGVNWAVSNVQGSHNRITFIDNLTGYLCSDSGRAYKTTNSGINWLALNSGTNSHLTSLSFLNSLTGIIAGHEKTIIKTTDGGSSWVSIANFTEQINLLNVKMLNENLIFACGSDSYIIKTTNGGNTWNVQTQNMPNPMFAIDFINENTGWVTGCCGMFMSTANSGEDWSKEYYLTLGFTLHSLKFINNSTGYTVGDNGGIYRSTNGGLWWDSTVTTTLETLYSIFMVNNNTGWVVGGYGTILKTTNGGGQGYTIGINQISAEIPNAFSLYQNYPNPFNPSTKIKFDVPPLAGSNENIKLTVYDILGNEVSVLVNNNLTAGTYEVRFDASGFPSGVYFYKLNSGSSSVSRKMVLVK